jgi:hypothetical protein
VSSRFMLDLLSVAADASLTRMPTFGWTTIASGESLLLKRFVRGRHGQSVVGIRVDIVSAPTDTVPEYGGVKFHIGAPCGQRLVTPDTRRAAASRQLPVAPTFGCGTKLPPRRSAWRRGSQR